MPFGRKFLQRKWFNLAGRGRLGRGKGFGRMGGFGLGPGGECVCPNCGERVVHQRGVPCYTLKCPKCGTPMIRMS